jgi:hypothetical protein
LPNTVAFGLEIAGSAVVTPHVDLVEAYERANSYVDPAGGYGGLDLSARSFGRLGDYLMGRTFASNFPNLDGTYTK